MTDDEIPKARALSYCCPFRCGPAHERGFVDLERCLVHIAENHRQKRKPTIKRWPHGVEAYEANGPHFNIGPMR